MKPPLTEIGEIRAWLGSEAFSAEPVIEMDGAPLVLDLSAGSLALGQPLDNLDARQLGALIDAAMQKAGVRFALGRWGEHRGLYQSEYFTSGDEARTVHLGVDVFCAARTRVQAPLDGVVDILANNARELDYGPLVILKHSTPGGQSFWTVYGHLGDECLKELRAGMPIGAGESFATVGAPPGNGNWPPHLHFQLVLDLLDLGRDFPGVAAAGEQERWLRLSPNPAGFFPGIDAAALDGRERSTS